MSFNGQLLATGGVAQCLTDSVQVFGADGTYSSNVALYQLNSDGGTTNNVPDTTGNYNGTSVSVTYATGYIDNAAVFNGSTSVIQASGLNQFFNNWNDASWSAWIKTTATSSQFIVCEQTSSQNYKLTASISSNKLGITVRKSGTVYTANSTTNINDGNWHHIAATYENSTGIAKGYVDGSEEISFSTGAAISATFSVYDFCIGANKQGSDIYNPLDGSIDQVRIFSTVLNQTEVDTLYAETSSTASSTNPFNEGPATALYSYDYDASDTGGLYDGTPTDISFGVGGHINTAAGFDGSSSAISIADGGIGNNATARVTYSISLWVKTTSTSVGAIISDYASYYSLYLQMEANGLLYMGNYYTSGGSNFTYGTTAINDGNWHNLVIINNTSDNTQKLFIDGSNTPDINHTLSTGTKTSSALQVGYYSSVGGYYLDGSIDQLRLFQTALTEGQMDTLYAETACVYTCTTDTVNYPSTTNLAYYKLDNSADDETGVYDGTSTDVNYSFGRFGQAAVFNGSSSDIVFPQNTAFDLNGTGSFSLWVNRNDTAQRWIFEKANGGSGAYGWQLYFNSTEYFFQIHNTSDGPITVQSGSGFLINTWEHIVITSSASKVYKMYVNGVLKDTETLSGTVSVNTNGARLGEYSLAGGYNFSGKIDQLRFFTSELTLSQVTELYNEKPCADTSNFKAVLYEGASSYVSNVGFQPDLLWVKGRTFTSNNRLFDVVRTASAGSLSSNQTAGNATASGQIITSFEANGFIAPLQAGDVNQSGQDFVAWNWKAGGDAVNIPVNSITGSTPSVASDVSANTAAGFSIVKWSGDASLTQTVAHGLSSAPQIVVMKSLSSSAWYVLTTLVTGTNPAYLVLNDTAQALSATFTSTATTFTNFGYGGDTIAYCWHSAAGYSKMDFYTGTSVTHIFYTTDDGTSGGSNPFQPSFLIIKRTDSSDAWQIYDNQRGATEQLMAQSADSEYTQDGTSLISFNSNGFTLGIDNSGRVNASGAKYLFMAFK